MMGEYTDDLEEGIDDDLKFEAEENINVDEVKINTVEQIKMNFPVLGNMIDSCSKTDFGKNLVFKNDSLFDRERKTSWVENRIRKEGKNSDRMATGRAAIGTDDKPVNLHHIYQTPDGPIIELNQTYHQSNYSALHKNTGQLPSQINRNEFAAWRKSYWSSR